MFRVGDNVRIIMKQSCADPEWSVGSFAKISHVDPPEVDDNIPYECESNGKRRWFELAELELVLNGLDVVFDWLKGKRS
jgi:hypothetical protein